MRVKLLNPSTCVYTSRRPVSMNKVFIFLLIVYSIPKMAAPDQSSIEQQISSLRAELKDWEKTFSDANGGRKAGRDDIKKDPTIGNQTVSVPFERGVLFLVLEY